MPKLNGMEDKGFGRICAILITYLFLQKAQAQDALNGSMTTALGDVASIKQKAEAGDARSQVMLGDALISNFRPLDALDWYRKAASQGNIEAAYHTGHLLLYGGTGIPRDQTVAPNPPEGIRWTFQAATNFYPDALHDMSRANQHGLAVGTNWVQAYAWQQIYAESSSGSLLGKVELNQMALKLDTAVIRQGQQLAVQFKQGNWQPLVIEKIPDEGNLTLKGIIGGSVPLAMINGKTFAEGESQMLTTKRQGPITVKCIKIEKDFVLVSVEGEESPRRLLLKLQGLNSVQPSPTQSDPVKP
jgi:hypothetical protein